MKTLKVIITILLTTAISVAILIWFLRKYGFRSMQFALIANLILFDWVGIVSSALGEKYRFYFPKSYYRAKRFEKDGYIYQFIGVQYFKKLVSKGPLAILASIHFHGKRDRLDYYYKETLWGEAIHGVEFLMILVLALYALIRGWWRTAIYFMIFNTIINFYPIILQRYNRFRLLRVIELANALKDGLKDNRSITNKG